MNEADRSPFRRFPWVQLVFCVACLSMAGWTWMRYSYAWEVTGRELWRSLCPINTSAEHHDVTRWPGKAYVRFAGMDVDESWTTKESRASSYHIVPYPEEPERLVKLWIHADDGDWGRAEITVTPTRHIEHFTARQLEPTRTWPSLEAGNTLVRRVTTEVSLVVVEIDRAASRFHPTSIAGLVVGAMGAFVFGLYLRRWARERGAAQRAR